ncbi:MAG: RdgB/HAM1 family non-canonical purine NTP pyrophosphatase [Ignavibacteriota bacterium]
MKIILATHNDHKVRELVAIAGDIISVGKLPDNFPEIPETGTTLSENASIKSQTVFKSLGVAALADDTGLEVAALGGEPGVYSARYAGAGATFKSNCDKLLAAMAGITERDARFVTILCFTDIHGSDHFFEGEVEGIITASPRGSGGFGYDPIFEPLEGKGKTFAEMTSEEKNLISHRSRAMKKFLGFISAID